MRISFYKVLHEARATPSRYSSQYVLGQRSELNFDIGFFYRHPSPRVPNDQGL